MQDFSRTQDFFSRTPNFTLNPFIPKISKSFLLAVYIHFLQHKFWKHYCLNQADFQDFPGPVVFFHDFSIQENVKMNSKTFQDPYEPWFKFSLMNQQVKSMVPVHGSVRHANGIRTNYTHLMSMYSSRCTTYTCEAWSNNLSSLIAMHACYYKSWKGNNFNSITWAS